MNPAFGEGMPSLRVATDGTLVAGAGSSSAAAGTPVQIRRARTRR